MLHNKKERVDIQNIFSQKSLLKSCNHKLVIFIELLTELAKCPKSN
jgi:hypothetical protein